ncbi:MAG TPA: hypothetical protein VK695_11865 [Steroidobacteraceae bacterium]|jgi:hypothetical protein|nr:hypothetical protein [Steroidobacteraceae bacterium]
MHSDLTPPQALTQVLRALPGELAQPYDFAEFERRAQRQLQAARRRSAGRRIALAAVAAAAALVVYLRGFGPAAPPAPLALTAPAQAQSVPAGHPEVLDHWLAALPREPAMVQVGPRAAVTGLEDRIAQVDDLLSAARVAQPPPARLLALQQERTQLVGALVQVRYAEALVAESR